MKPALALLLCIAVPMSVFADDNSYKVTYDGRSLPELKSGTGMRLFIESKQIRLVRDKADVILIPASAVTEISDRQDVHRRVGAAIGLATITLGLGARLH